MNTEQDKIRHEIIFMQEQNYSSRQHKKHIKPASFQRLIKPQQFIFTKLSWHHKYENQ